MNSARDPEHLPDADPVDGATPGGTAADETVAASGTGGLPTAGAGAAGQLIFDDPLDRPSPDDTDRGWGEASFGGVDDDFTRFLNEKPPHHI